MRKQVLLLIVMLICMAICGACVETETSECAHSGGTATCQAKAICEKCGEEYGELADHVYGAWQHDETKHWKECTTEGCTAKAEEGNHEGGTATCQAKAVCEKCGVEYGVLGAHSYTIWRHNDEKHWKECECGAKSEEEAAHTLTDEYNDTQHWQKCECGYETEKVNHTLTDDHEATQHWQKCACGYETEKVNHTLTVDHDATQHWQKCECGYITEKENHVGGTATCTELAVCTECGAAYGVLAAHSYTTWRHDDAQHWKECECGATTERTDHIYNEWDSTNSSYDYKVCECGMKTDIDAFDKTVSLFNQNINLSGSTCAIKLSGISEFASVESIMFGDYNLGNDISELVVTNELKADTVKHGKQLLTVTVKDADGGNHVVSVPVTFITAEISTADEFKAIQPSSTTKGVYGYYVLKNNISDNSLAGSAYAKDWEETTGFFGTVDGQGYTISTAANGENGIFGILRNATIKNVIITDNWRSAYQSYALLAKACFNSKLENVTFTLAAGNTQAQVGDGYGWISYAEFSGNTLKNVTVNDTKGYGSLFGFKFYNNVFDNVKINGTYTEMGHTANVVDENGNLVEAGKSVTYDDVTKAAEIEKVTLDGRQDFVLDGKNSEINLGEYADCEILSIMTSTGYELYSLSSIDVNVAFKNAKQLHGEQNIIVTVSRNGNVIEITVPVTVITKVITKMADLQATVKYTKGADNIYGYYVLGNDVAYTEADFKAVTAIGGWSGDNAFKGTLDGRNFTITANSSGASYGLFGTLNGATIKNVKIKDAWNSGANCPLIARNAYGTTFENVNIEITGGNKVAGTADNTPIIGHTMQKCVWKNSSITSSVEIENVFANQSSNDFSGGLEIDANITSGFSVTTADYPDGVTVKKN